jgi:DNA-binding CsgD family transcriptional regulator
VSAAILMSRTLTMDRGAYETRTRIVRQISKVIAEQAMTVDELLDAVTEAICEQTGDTCVVGILFDDGRKIHPLGVYHPEADRRRDLESLADLPHETVEGVIRRVLEYGEPEVISPADLERASRTRPWAEALLAGTAVRSALAVPMRAFGADVGILALARSTQGPDFADDEVPFVHDMADRLALAVHALHLEEELERVTTLEQRAGPADERLAALTTREREILALIATGLSSREIGEQLFLSVRTVEWYRARLMVKVAATKRSELIAIGRLLEP